MDKIEEFWYCVAPQEDLPLYKGKEISVDTCKNLIDLTGVYRERIQASNARDVIKTIILEKPEIISDIRVLVGISDKRLYLDLTYLVHIFVTNNSMRLVPEAREHLLKHDTKFFINYLKTSSQKAILANLIVEYFIAHGIIDILTTFSALSNEQIAPLFDNLIAPKEIQQMQAKYRGHGAEQAFARCFTYFGANIVPEGKDIDPMAGYDPNVDLSNMTVVSRDTSNQYCHSFDLVVRDSSGNIRLLIQSLIHSSDPGQYGVNKSDETIIIKKMIEDYNRKHPDKKVYLLGSVDGVGFSENPRGTIEKMLVAFDDFFQMNTLFKIPILLQKFSLINNVVGISFDTSFFSPLLIQHFTTHYLTNNHIANMTGSIPSNLKQCSMGKAIVIYR